MQRVAVLLACLLTFAVVLPARAGGHGHGYGSHYRGSGNHWLAPVLGAALVKCLGSP